jgi:carotenoid cleavage dioxygenase-like enzyme
VVRKRDGAVVERYESAPFFSFHHVNAFERDGEVYVDLLAYADAQVIHALYLDVLRGANDGIAHPPSELRRYRLVPGKVTVEYEALCDETLELPIVNYNRVYSSTLANLS